MLVKSLTKRQKEVLDFISSFSDENGFAPSLREIAAFLQTKNLSTAQYFVEELKQKGYLQKEANKTRGLVPFGKRQTAPLLGYIAAGEPIDPIENPEVISIPDNIHLDENKQYYALKVKGDSMKDMDILDGDTVLIQHQLTARDGDVVVAITEKGATLKVLRKRDNYCFLEAKNKDFLPIYPQTLEIRGKYVGLVRTP